MSSTRIEYLDSKIQYGRGKAATVYGQTFNIYRLTNQSGSILDGHPIFADFPLSPIKTGKGKVENQVYDLQIFDAAFDNTLLKLGDYFVEVGQFDDREPDHLIFAQRRPFRGRSLMIRCESNVTITRPQPLGGGSGQQPRSGGIRAPGYIGITKKNERGMLLANGMYFFSNSLVTTPIANSEASGLAAVPAALLQLNRIRDATIPKLPVSLFREHFVIYIPPLNGIMLQELDRLNFQNSDRYEIGSLFLSEEGFVGNIAICEKLGT